jgi:hypothetical protein
MRITPLGIGAALLAIGCSSLTAPEIVGEWGGTEASLALTRLGGTVSYACGAGTIDSTWTLTPAGQFEASGQHFFGGGPVPAEGRTPHPALYHGDLEGDHLTLSVTLLDLDQTIGPFHLVRGGPPVTEICL